MAEEKTRSFLQVLKAFLTGEEYGNKKGKRSFLLALLAIGIMMMLAGSMLPFGGTGPDKEPETFTEQVGQTTTSYSAKEEVEHKLKEVLSNIEGVSNVHVFVNFETKGELKYAQNVDEVERKTSETDREGGMRDIYELNRKHEYVLYRDEGGEKALLLEELMPKVKGVLVVADGMESRSTQLKIVRAIQRVMDLPVHRIAVLPSNDNR